MRNLHLLILALGALVVPLAGSARLCGDEVRWRESYAAAYQEAAKTGQPLLMEFGTEACFWCKKLEGTTLSTPEVTKLINDRFIPVRIDAQVEVDLARAVAVQTFPTLFILAPDRTILNRHEGFAEAATIVQFLEQGLKKTPPPATIARSADEGPTTSKSPVPFKVASRRVEPATTDGATRSERKSRAHRLVTLAQQDFDDGCYLACMDRCRLILKDFAELEECSEARSLVERITGSPPYLRSACTDFGEGLAELYRKLADEALRSGQKSVADEYQRQAIKVSLAIKPLKALGTPPRVSPASRGGPRVGP